MFIIPEMVRVLILEYYRIQTQVDYDHHVLGSLTVYGWMRRERTRIMRNPYASAMLKYRFDRGFYVMANLVYHYFNETITASTESVE